MGAYQVSDAQPASDPIDCGDDPFADNNSAAHNDGEWRICIDSPAPDEFDNARVKVKPKK